MFMKKGLNSLGITMILLLLLMVCIGPVYAGPCGDVNSSGTADIVDALNIAQFYVNLDPQPFDESVADVNGDGQITITDALLVAQYYVKMIDTLDGCVMPTVSPVGNNCMFVACDPGYELEEFDDFIIPRLEAWGYVIDKKHFTGDLDGYTAADYAPYDFIFVSESALSGDVVPLRDIPLPMLCSDGWMAKESSLGFATGEPCNMIARESVIFLDGAAGHPLAAGYTPGTVFDLCTTTAEVALIWSQPTISVIPIAGLASDPTRLLVYGIEQGTPNAHGTPIGNRVVMVGVHAFGYSNLTDEAVDLYNAGIEWILAQ
jgi:hypothetical protein